MSDQHEQNDRRQGITSYVGGWLTDEEWQARGAGHTVPPGDDEEPTITGDSGLPPRGSGAPEEDPRYKDVRTIATGGYAAGFVD
jgi:hypothetical protein